MVRIAEVIPDVVLGLFAHLTNNGLVALLDASFDLSVREGVDRVTGNDRVPQGGRFRVETGRAISASEHPPGQISLRQGEHSSVLVEGTSPWNDLVQPHGRRTHGIHGRFAVAGPMSSVIRCARSRTRRPLLVPSVETARGCL